MSIFTFNLSAGEDVGIGTSSPADRLNVNIDTDGEGITISAANLKPMFTGNSNRSAENNTIAGFSGKWNGTEVARIAVEAGPDTTNKDDGSLTFFTRTSGSGLTKRLSIEENGDVLPGADSTYDIGSNSNRFANGYFDTLYGDGSNLTGVSSVGGSTGVDFNDNVKARFGNSNDLEIYHSGSNSHITDNGTGDLKLRGSEAVKIEDTSSGKPMITCTKNFGTEIYHQMNSAVATAEVKFATTSTGVTITGNALPATNNAHDLGSSSKRWANLFVNDLKMSNNGKQNDVDGTWGDYTIQEGHEDLFLINHRTGKKFKFNLTEVG